MLHYDCQNLHLQACVALVLVMRQLFSGVRRLLHPGIARSDRSCSHHLYLMRKKHSLDWWLIGDGRLNSYRIRSGDDHAIAWKTGLSHLGLTASLEGVYLAKDSYCVSFSTGLRSKTNFEIDLNLNFLLHSLSWKSYLNVYFGLELKKVGYHDRCSRLDFYDTQMKSLNKFAALLFF